MCSSTEKPVHGNVAQAFLFWITLPARHAHERDKLGQGARLASIRGCLAQASCAAFDVRSAAETLRCERDQSRERSRQSDAARNARIAEGRGRHRVDADEPAFLIVKTSAAVARSERQLIAMR